MHRGILICLLSVLFTSCLVNKEDSSDINVFTLKGPSAISMLNLMEEYAELDGIPLRFKIMDEPLQVRASMLKEEADFAVLPTTMAVNLYNKGVPYQLAAVPVWGTIVVIGKRGIISSWADLKGKRVHLMAKGMTPDILFRYLAERNGLDPESDLILDYSFPTHTDLANAVIASLSDIAVLSEPMVSMVIAQNSEVAQILNLDNEWRAIFGNEFPMPQTSLLVKKSFAEENPKKVLSFLEKYENSCNWVNNNLQTSAELTIKYEILPDVSVAINSIPGCNIRFLPSWELKTSLNSYLEVFYNFDPRSIGGKLPDENFFFEK